MGLGTESVFHDAVRPDPVNLTRPGFDKVKNLSCGSSKKIARNVQGSAHQAHFRGLALPSQPKSLAWL